MHEDQRETVDVFPCNYSLSNNNTSPRSAIKVFSSTSASLQRKYLNPIYGKQIDQLAVIKMRRSCPLVPSVSLLS